MKLSKPLSITKPATAALSNWTCIGTVIWFCEAVGWNIATGVLAIMVTGVHLHRNAILGHDGAHFLISSDRRLNDLLANLFFFWPAGGTVSGYRAWHFLHHRWVGTPRDSEHATKAGPRYQTPKRRAALIRDCALDLVGGGVLEILRLQWVIRPRRFLEFLGPVGWWVLAGLSLYVFDLLHVGVIILVSLFTSFAAINRLRGWCEHIAIEGTHRFHANALMRYVFFPHNTWCHYEHHRWPNVPYYLLPQARSELPDEPVVSLSDVLKRFETPFTSASVDSRLGHDTKMMSPASSEGQRLEDASMKGEREL